MNHQHIPSAAERLAAACDDPSTVKGVGSISMSHLLKLEVVDLRARIAELEAAALAAQPVKVEPTDERAAFDEWAASKGLLPHAIAARWSGWEARAALTAIQPAAPQEPLKQNFAQALHYPDCWDTAIYPTLADALSAVYDHFKCSECSPTAPDAAAVRDTKRLDFIERNSVCKYNSAGINWQLGQYDLPGRYLTLREAIDAAIAGSPAATKEPQ